MQVLKIVKEGNVYRAYKSRTYGQEYQCLVDMLGLNCESPVFGCPAYHRQVTGGKISTSVKMVLKVPDDQIKLTEYPVWADFIYYFKFTKPGDYTRVRSDAMVEIKQKKLDKIIRSLKTQKSVWRYHSPQVIMEEIRPEWLVDYKVNLR